MESNITKEELLEAENKEAIKNDPARDIKEDIKKLEDKLNNDIDKIIAGEEEEKKPRITFKPINLNYILAAMAAAFVFAITIESINAISQNAYLVKENKIMEEYKSRIKELEATVSTNNAKIDELEETNGELSEQVADEHQELFSWVELIAAELDEIEEQNTAMGGEVTERKYPEGILNKHSGVNWFEGHKETYYNLPMEGVIRNANRKGNYDGYEYAVRDDGVKTFGGYVICAANYTVHPYGSIINTSLGEGIVLDTGGFALHSPEAIDIAVDW